MKNTKLNLNALKVKSFVTSLGNDKELTVKGGARSDRYESRIICEEAAPTVGCGVETFATACGCRTH